MSFKDYRMNPERLEALRVMLVDKKMTSRAIQQTGVHPSTIVRAKMLLGIPTRREIAAQAQREEAERKREEEAAKLRAGVPASELSIGRCVWLVSQSPRLFCGKPEHPECKPYCLTCDPLARRNRKPLGFTASTSTTKGRSAYRRA